MQGKYRHHSPRNSYRNQKESYKFVVNCGFKSNLTCIDIVRTVTCIPLVMDSRPSSYTPFNVETESHG